MDGPCTAASWGCAAALAFACAAAADVGAQPLPWDAASRTFALAPGTFGDDAAGAVAGRAFDASVWHAAGFGFAVDGELWRIGQGGSARAALLADAAAGWRAFDSPALRVEVLAGARVDASVLDARPSAWDAANAPFAAAAPMAGARATLGIAEGVSLAVRAGVAPDEQLDPAWRLGGTLRLSLADGWALVLDARWQSEDAAGIPGTATGDGAGRGAVRAGLRVSF